MGSLTRFLPTFLLSPRARVERARSLFDKGKRASALQIVDSALARHRVDSGRHRRADAEESWLGDALHLKGVCHWDEGQRAEAIEALQTACTFVEANPPLAIPLAQDLIRVGICGPEAQGVYLVFFQFGWLVLEKESYTRVIRDLATVSAPPADPGTPPERLAEVCAWNEVVARRLPDYFWPHFHIGQVALELGDISRAITALEAAQAVASTTAEKNGALLLISSALARDGQFIAALRPLDSLIQQGIHLPEALRLRAYALRFLGRHEEALSDLLEAARRRELCPEERLAAAESAVVAGMLSEAERLIALAASQDSLRGDPRITLLQSALLQEQGRADKGTFTELRFLLMDALYADDAADHILTMITRWPRLPGATDTLNDIAAKYPGNERIVTARIVLQLAYGDIEGALTSWQTIGSISESTRQSLFAMLGAGITERLQQTFPSGNLLSAVTALAIFVLQGIVDKKYNTSEALSHLECVCYSLDIAVHPSTIAAKAVILNALQRHEEALPLFVALPLAMQSQEEIAIQYALCLLHTGETEANLNEILLLLNQSTVKSTSESMGLLLLIALLEHDWCTAEQHLVTFLQLSGLPVKQDFL